MISEIKLKQCINNCNFAGDIERDLKEYNQAAIMVIFLLSEVSDFVGTLSIIKENAFSNVLLNDLVYPLKIELSSSLSLSTIRFFL